MMRIMFMANAPWCTTGYGVQGKHLVWRWKKLGYEVAYFAFYGLANGLLTIDGVRIYPMGYALWGEDILPAHMKHFGAHVLVTLMDVWVTDFFGRMAQEHGWAWCPWLPVDQEPVPEAVVVRLEGCHTALPYSRFGERELLAAGVERVHYIPHGVDTRRFHVPSPEERAQARKLLGLPQDVFVIGTVAANKGYPSRKALPEQLLAFREFKRHVPKAIFYLHTLMSSMADGVNLAKICERLGLRIGEDVVFCDQYRYVIGFSEDWMTWTYMAFDLFSLPSMGEGFGIPLIEAQACGVPVVTTRASSMPELTFAGICTEPAQKFWTPLNSWAVIPSVERVAEAYLEMFERLQDPRARQELALRARAGAEQFDWDIVVSQYWAPFLAQLAEELGVADQRSGSGAAEQVGGLHAAGQRVGG